MKLAEAFKHRLVRNSAMYAVGGFTQEAVPFLLLPILTRYLSPYDYGLTATFMVVLSVLLVFIGLSLQGALAVNYFKRPAEERAAYLSATVAIQTVAFVAVAALVWLARGPLAAATAFPAGWFVVVAVCAFSQSLMLSALTLWQVEQKPLPYSVFRLVVSAANVGISLLLVVSYGWGWRGRTLGVVIAFVGGACAALVVLLRRGLGARIERRHVAEALHFGVPLIPHGLSGILSDAMSRIFINRMVSVSESGIYSVGYQLGSIILFGVMSFNYAWSPYLLERLPQANDATKRRIVHITYVYAVVVAAAALVLAAGAHLALRLLAGERFAGAARYVPLFALSGLFSGLYFMVVNYVFYSQRTHLLAAITFLCGAAAVGMTWFLIPRLGAMGAAYATLASNVLMFLLTWRLAQRLYPMPWLRALRERGSDA
jgi:O-antigen/teichoic acid export membrane protein